MCLIIIIGFIIFMVAVGISGIQDSKKENKAGSMSDKEIRKKILDCKAKGLNGDAGFYKDILKKRNAKDELRKLEENEKN